MKFKSAMKLRLLFIVILLCIAGGASADDADRLIADFDRKADVGGIKGINGISAKGFGGIGDLVSPPGSGMKEPVTQMTLQYSAGHMYRNGKLERVDNPYGYWADGSFHYHITDYQGNIRAVIDEDGTLEEVNNYYPYGGLMGAGAMGVQPYKYGAKELDRENGLDLYDSHARFYDSMIGRTTSQDPLAEKYYEMSPYLWCAANPIKFGDKNGMYLKGIDGNPVFFDKKRGWTSNATPSIAKIGGAMMRTKQGKKILSRMMKTDYPITLLIDRTSTSNRMGEITAGETYSDYTFDDNAKSQDFKEVVIVIYEKVIKDNMQNEEFYRDSSFSTSDIIGTVAAHEGEHGTNKKANSGFVSEEEAETKALNSEKKAIDDLKKRNKKASR